MPTIRPAQHADIPAITEIYNEAGVGTTASYALGAPAVEGETVVVVATVVGKPGQEVPPALPIVLRRDAGRWRIDMGASMTRLLGVDLGALMETMAKGLGDAMASGFSALSRGLDATTPPPAS